MLKTEHIPIHPLNSHHPFFAIKDLIHDNQYDYNRTHRHGYYEIIITRKGGGFQWIDFKKIALKDNSCYIISPKQVHLLKRAPSASGTVVQFTEEVIKDTQLSGLLRIMDNPVFFEENPDFISETGKFTALLQVLSASAKPFNRIVLEGVIQSLAYHLLGYVSVDKTYSGETLINKFLQLVEMHYFEWHSLSYYKQLLGVTESKLGKITKKHLGYTPLQIIHNRLLLEAKRLLFFQEKSVKEIAYELGFNYPSNFTHFIKSKTGFTPKQLIRQARENEIHK